MKDAALLLAVVVAATSAGLVFLRALRALPEAPGERLVPGLAAGLGLTGLLGLALAGAGVLRPVPVAVAGVVAVLAGGADLARAVGAVDRAALRRAWPFLAVAAIVLATEVVTMLAPPVGGDQTKYQLAYPRLFAAAGRVVPTPWCIWGEMQFLENFVYAVGFALSGDTLARFLNATLGVAVALAVAGLVRHHLSRSAARWAGLLVFTLPITWSLMTRAGSDLAVVLFATLATDAVLAGSPADLRRAGVFAGFAAGSKVLGLLVPTLVGVALLVWLVRRTTPLPRALAAAATFGVLVLVVAAPYYVRATVDTGNPLFPFGFRAFGGRHWSAAASEYLEDYYQQYQSTYATRRDGGIYEGIEVARFPWDLTMHPESFENGARASLDIGPFMLAFLPALVVVTRRRPFVATVAAIGVAYAATIAVAAWAHPRYVFPGVVLALAAAVPAAWAFLGRRVATAVLAFTIAGNVAVTSRLLVPMWPDQLSVATGRLAPEAFLRKWSSRFAFWERANAAMPPDAHVMVLEKIPHPYYIERPFVLASYLEQGFIDYRRLDDPEKLAARAHELGITHVAVDVTALTAGGDPFEAAIARLWSGFVARECDVVLRDGTYALYALREPTAIAAAGGGVRG